MRLIMLSVLRYFQTEAAIQGLSLWSSVQFVSGMGITDMVWLACVTHKTNSIPPGCKFAESQVEHICFAYTIRRCLFCPYGCKVSSASFVDKINVQNLAHMV